MSRKNLNARIKIPKLLIDKLKNKKINSIYKRFEQTLNIDENFAVVSNKNIFEAKTSSEPFEKVLTEKFWEQFSSQVYLFLHNISLEDVASDSMEPCQAVLSFEKA